MITKAFEDIRLLNSAVERLHMKAVGVCIVSTIHPWYVSDEGWFRVNEPGPLVIRSWSDAHQKLIRCVLIFDYQILLSKLLVWCQMPSDSQISEGIWSTSDDQRSRSNTYYHIPYLEININLQLVSKKLENFQVKFVEKQKNKKIVQQQRG